jgi:hypothetical protein
MLRPYPIHELNRLVGWVEARLRCAQAALTPRVRVAQNPTSSLGFASLNPTYKKGD